MLLWRWAGAVGFADAHPKRKSALRMGHPDLGWYERAALFSYEF